MTLDGYHVDVMSSKTWAYWIFFVGFVLSLDVAENCLHFNNYVTRNLFKDHLFVIQDFQRPGEPAEVEYTVLSIVNMLCSSLRKHEGLHVYDSNKDLTKEDGRVGAKWAYDKIVRNFLNLTSESNITTNCEKHACNFSYSITYISLVELEETYKSVCSWKGSLPACPSPENTSPSPSQVSSTAPTSAPAYTSPSPSQVSSTAPTSAPAYTSPSPSQVSSTAPTSAPAYPSTSTPSPTTSHRSMSTSASALGPRNMTAPSASNNTETPPACPLTTCKPSADNPMTPSKIIDNLKVHNQTFLLLLTVSSIVNVVLIIAVCWQRSRHQRYPKDSSEAYQECHNIELVLLRNGDQDCPEDCLQYQNAELIQLQTRDQSQSEANGIPSYPTT